VSLIRSIAEKDEGNGGASSFSSSDLQDEVNNETRPESPTVNGEGEPGEEEDSEVRPLIRHRSGSISRYRASSEQQVEDSQNCSTSLSASEAQKVQRLVKKLRLQVGSTSTLCLEW
jgi:hypothetical protein